MIKTSEFDYELPQELIAQFPCEKRDLSKLMVLDKNSKTIEHKQFFNIVDYFDENDVIVLNNTKVLPARLIGRKVNPIRHSEGSVSDEESQEHNCSSFQTGARIEVFLLKNLEAKKWEVLIKPSKRVKEETKIIFSELLCAKVINKLDNGKWIVEFEFEGDFYGVLSQVGNVPLPPYIERQLTDKEINSLDEKRYQTVYAKNLGSVAAPTAGLHFTDEIIQQLEDKGVQVCYVNLTVGLGTFRPVSVDNILEHKMDSEVYEIDEKTAKTLMQAKQAGKRITAVGTTSVRTLESCFKKYNEVRACKDNSELFIYPGFKFGVVDRLITNFHLPKSTLIMLVSALAGKDFVLDAYNQAIEEKYRFYSYGDSMFIK